MKEQIRQKALQLGWDLCGFARAEPLEKEAPRLQRWVEAGYHAGMDYMARTLEKRLDPALVLPGVRTVVVVAASYWWEGWQDHPSRKDSLKPRPNHGRVARYARYRDYHKVLRQPLRQLEEFLHRIGPSGLQTRAYLDTGPVLERAWGARAGIGFIGKNTQLIHPRYGSWLFLGVILMSWELPPDPPMPTRCGTCRRCLEACPTRALQAPYELDARKCLSYLTIEHRGPIPSDLRSKFSGWVFGCDRCLEVCPWNRFARSGKLMTPWARPELEEPNLLEWLQKGSEGLIDSVRGTPLMRAKVQGLLRNALVALGETGTEEALPELERFRQGADPLLAEHAAWAMDRIRERYR